MGLHPYDNDDGDDDNIDDDGRATREGLMIGGQLA